MSTFLSEIQGWLAFLDRLPVLLQVLQGPVRQELLPPRPGHSTLQEKATELRARAQALVQVRRVRHHLLPQALQELRALLQLAWFPAAGRWR